MDESADPTPHPVPVIGALGGGGGDGVDERATLPSQEVANTILLGVEELVEGGLRGACLRDDLVD